MTTRLPVVTTAAPATTAAPVTTAVPTTPAPAVILAPPPPSANAPFPAALVGPVPAVAGSPPELDVIDLYTAFSEDLSAPDVVVRFKAPFSLPGAAYKVSILIGDPTGRRLRVSMVSPGGSAKPKGLIETYDGVSWKEGGATSATFDTGGFVIVRVPFAAAPAGGSVWAEIREAGNETPLRVTPFYARDALFATAVPKGSLPTSVWARATTADGAPVADPVSMPPGPTVTVGDGLVGVAYASTDPTDLLGSPVTEVVDNLRIAPNFDNGAVVNDLVRIDRNTGTLTLLDGFGIPPTDKSGDRSWVVAGFPAGQSTAAAMLLFDLPKMAAALGIELGAETTGIGLSRTFVLADGRVVTVDTVLGTSKWFDLGPAPAVPVADTTIPAQTDATVSSGPAPGVLAAGVAGVLVLVLLGLLLVRRRGRRAAAAQAEAERAASDPITSGIDRVPWARDDGAVTARATAEIEQIKLATGAVPVIATLADLAPADPEPAAEPGGGGVAGATDAPTGWPVGGASPTGAFGSAGSSMPAVVVLAGEPARELAARERTPPMGTPAVDDPVAVDADADADNAGAAGATAVGAVPAPEGSADAPDREDDRPPAGPAAKVDPFAALAAFDLEVTALKDRLDQLDEE